MNQGGFLQAANTPRTASVLSNWLSDTFYETATETQPFEKLFHKITERVALSATIGKGVTCKRLPSAESAYPFKFQSYVSIDSGGVDLLYKSFKNSYTILIYYKGKLESKELPIRQNFHTEGPPDDAWTVSDWVFDAPKECNFPENKYISDMRTEICGLLNNFKKGLRLNRPSTLLSMAKQVANQYDERKNEDIEAWAEKLSKDLSKLSD